MLKLAEKEDIKKIESFCKSFPLGVHTNCKLSAYGLERDFFKVWYAFSSNKINAVISYFDGSVILCAESDADLEEIAAFVSTYGYESVCAEKSIFDRCGFKAASEKTMFKFTQNDCLLQPCENVCDMKKVYDLISRSIPDSFAQSEEAYLHFLSDFTFRQRRNLARVKAVFENNKLLSCALTAAEIENAALISGVACDSEARGKGLGKRTVLSLANELQKEKKAVYVIALNDSAKAFYKKIGFNKCCTVMYAER